MKLRFAIVVFLCVSTTVLTACQPPWIVIRNTTDETLVLVGLQTLERGFSGPGEVELESLDPGEEYITRGDCQDLVYVVKTVDGDYYAAEPHQMCGHDEWVITGPD